MPMNPRELRAAATDAFAIRSGVNITNPHPLAEQVGRLPLKDLAEQFGEASGKPLSAAFTAFRAGLSSSDFGAAMGEGLRVMMLHQFNVMAEHRQVCAPLEVKDFRVIDLDFLDIGDTLAPVGEGGEIPHQDQGVIVGNGGSAKLTSYARALHVSRQVIVNDAWGILQRAFASLGGSSARLEDRMVFEALEANPTLGDGEPLFHADHGNTMDAALNGTALGSAMAMLRKQKTPSGEQSGNRAKYLCVSPAEEFAARLLIHESGLDMNVVSSVSIVSSPTLEAGRWYLMADPVVAPVVTRLHLPGAANIPFRLEPVRSPDGRDGLSLRLATDLGVSVISRVGCIRGGSV